MRSNIRHIPRVTVVLASLAACLVVGCPPATPPAGWPPAISPGMDVMVPMPDGKRLITDIYAPTDPNYPSPWPVILLRTPYNPNPPGDPIHTDRGASYNSYGVVYIVQSSRGFFGSEDTHDFFAGDGKDGRDMITLLAAQSWCNGKIAMQGHSAPGIEAYMALPNTQGTKTELACAWIADATPDLYKTIYQGGVFRKKLVGDWLTATGQTDLLTPIVQMATFEVWWAFRQITYHYGKIAAPAVHMTGWFDIFMNEQIDGFVGARKAGAPAQYLIVGPWHHDGIDQTQQGQLTFPANANAQTEAVFEEFMARYLFDEGSLSGWPVVRYYTMGDVDSTNAPGNEWRDANDWPPYTPNPQTFYLGKTGSVGTLSTTAPSAASSSSQYTYDPNSPAPTVGGNNLFLPAGPYDQSAVEARADVLTFTTGVLASPVEATGNVQAKIYLQCSQPDTDLIVRLSDVYPDGRSMMITEGALRLRFRNPAGPAEGELMTPGKTYEINLDLWPTSIIFNTGHRIRIAITSSSDPRFDPNPNTGDAFRANTNTAIATVTILHNQANPSQIILPTR